MKERLSLFVFIAGTALATTFAAKTVTGQSGSEKLWNWFSDAGLPFLMALAVMSAGAILLRRQRKSRGGPKQSGGRDRARAQLDAIAAAVAALPDPVPERAALAHTQLDEILEHLIPEFLEYREQLIAAMGLFDFARMIGSFASFERNLARTWSALTDEAFDEAGQALERARQSLERAQREF